MLIGGIQKFTTLDYPGKIAATIFTIGCNFRCPFCHNPEIIELDENAVGIIPEKEVLDFLATRQDQLDGVCITGGEPTLQKDLIPFIEKVRNLGFSVKLDTNGYNTEIVRKIIEKNLVDYFAIDVKTSFGKYDLVKAPAGAAENVLESIDIITENNISLELRTTVVPGIVTVDDFDDIIRGLNDKDENILPNLARYSVQAFRPQKCLDKNFESVKPYDDSVLEEIAEKLREYVKQVDIMK